MVDLILSEGFQTGHLLPEDQTLEKFTRTIQDYFRVILSRPITCETDRQILAECLSIWISDVTFNSDRLAVLYED
jgi:hypothetical protein